MPRDQRQLHKFAQLIRYYILTSTTAAGSGHPSSSLSAVELMVALMFGGFFCFDADNPENPNNDRLIFSKGHAAPLFYALWAVAGKVTEAELMTLRQFNSPLEGHPTPAFPFTEAATGSLGQGLPIGVGMALNAKLDNLSYRTYVLLGDSEMAEGSNWEALQIAAYYQLDNLVGIIDVNRLGQRGETMSGARLKEYEKRISAFGWQTIVIDGHQWSEIIKAYELVAKGLAKGWAIVGRRDKPVMIIAKTVKGKGVSFLENQDGWHGKVLSSEQLLVALRELGEIDKEVRGEIARPVKCQVSDNNFQTDSKFQIQYSELLKYQRGQLIATRKAYGDALVRIFPKYPKIVVLDAEVGNSTYAETFQKAYPERFIECFIAEQNMVGMAQGLARRGKIPFVSSFAAFLTRAFDQIRMSQYSGSNIKFVGSHSGVSIGADGASQMGLEDLAMFRTILEGVVLYPADAISMDRLVEEAARHQGIVYLRTTRPDTPVIYEGTESFSIGGSKVLRQSARDIATVVAAGITVHQALAAYEILAKENILIRVIDCYSIKPLDQETLQQAAQETKKIITVEDHFAEGGLGEAVAALLAASQTLLAVRRLPKSGLSQKLLDYEEISRDAIIRTVRKIINC